MSTEAEDQHVGSQSRSGKEVETKAPSGRAQWIKARNDQIEASLTMARNKTPNAIKLLLLGAGESGKSTVLKQMRLIHGSGFTDAELAQYTKVIWSDAVQSMRILISNADRLGIDLDSSHAASLLYQYNQLIRSTDPLRMYEEDLVLLSDKRDAAAAAAAAAGAGSSSSQPQTPHTPHKNFLDDYVLKYDWRKVNRMARADEQSVNIVQSFEPPSSPNQGRGGGTTTTTAPDSPAYYRDVVGEDDEALMSEYTPRDSSRLASKQDVAVAISELWKHDRGIAKVYARSNEFQLEVNASHYFERILHFCKPGFRVTDQDILMGRVKTTGISETVFNIKNWAFRVFDVGGQRSERRKWIHCFDDVTAIVFVAAVSEYDEVLFEDEWTNRMHEALVLFESICNSRWFSTTPIILFLNKIDVLARKLTKSPVTQYFPDYRGDERNVDEVCKYFQELFHAQNRNRQRPVYVHYTCATDTQSMKFVIAAVTDMIIQRSLLESGII